MLSRNAPHKEQFIKVLIELQLMTSNILKGDMVPILIYPTCLKVALKTKVHEFVPERKLIYIISKTEA